MLKHKHLIIRAEVLNPPKDPFFIKSWVSELINKIGMNLVQIPQNPNAFYSEMEGNRGLTCIAIIETSHIALHVWDEDTPSLVQLDVYSCSDLDINIVFEMIKEWTPLDIKFKFLDRENDLVQLM